MGTPFLSSGLDLGDREPATSAKRMLTRNTLLQERYRVFDKLGHGGMGAVYQALDEHTNSLVALKETFATTEELRRAFRREAQLLANLQHPALPVVKDYFHEGDGEFLVMQFIPGNNLAELLTITQRAFETEKVLDWADQLLDALEELHSCDPPIIHRDIKPANLKLTPKGRIILLDFGLAKGATGAMSLSEHAHSLSSVAGYTPSYAPLEQMRGTGTDPRSDLYSLGATLWTLLTGHKPPDALTRVADKEDGKSDPLRPAHEINPEVPPAVSATLVQAMSLNRHQRPGSAAEMRRALRAARSEASRAAAEQGQRREEEEKRRQAAEEQRKADEERRKAEEERRRAEDERRRADEERRRLEDEERHRLEEAASPLFIEEPVSEPEEKETMLPAPTISLVSPPERSVVDLPSETVVVNLPESLKEQPRDQTPPPKPPPPKPPPPTPTPQTPTPPKPTPGTGGTRRLLLAGLAVLALAVVVAGAFALWRWLGNSGAGQTTRDSQSASSKVRLPPVTNRAGVELVYVMPGSFMMGSQTGNDNEKPPHQVTFKDGFYIGKYEVTNAQWWAVMKTGVPSYDSDLDPKVSHLENFPARNISWDEAQRFIGKLNDMKDGYEYRLPSEAEWEYACRAGTTGDYAGNLDEMAWYSSNTRDEDPPAHPVGQKHPNAFGLYDMHGNVWEWCQDNYHADYSGTPPSDGSAWLVEGGAALRVIRGGSQHDPASDLRSARRLPYYYGADNYNFGFRVVAVPRK
jgi:formylglycine-generating enzyme required for sulfatase activity/serine/threonine protein kinase